MNKEKRNLQFTYKGRSIVVRAVSGEFCPKCCEGVLDDRGNATYSAALDRLVRETNLAALPDLRSIRKRLHLTQVEAAEMFGGGVNAFSRYERGETEPPKSLVQVFKLLDAKPELLELLRENSRVVVKANSPDRRSEPRHAPRRAARRAS